MNLSEKILLLRKQNNLSQEQLAEKLGVSRQAVSKWESSQATPDIDKIINISELFGVSTDYLLKQNNEDGDKMMLKHSKETITEQLSYHKITGIVLLVISLLSFILAFFAGEYIPFVLILGVLLTIVSLELLLIPNISWIMILWTIWGYCFLLRILFFNGYNIALNIVGIISILIMATGGALLTFTAIRLNRKKKTLNG